MKKIAIFLSHPIQYFSPLFEFIASNSSIIDLHVYYFSNYGVDEEQGESGLDDFGVSYKWDMPLLKGYKYTFLKNNYKGHPFNGYFGLTNFDIFSTLKNEKYDLVMTHGWHQFSNLLVFLAAKYNGNNFSIRAETPAMYEHNKIGLKGLLRKIILTQVFKRVDIFFYIGRQNYLFYRMFNIEKNKLLHTPYTVDNEYFYNCHKNNNIKNIKKSIGITNNDPVFLFSGKLIDRKQPEMLLKAFEIVRKILPCHLVIVGDGDMKKNLMSYQLENKVKNVFFTGFVNQSKIHEYYSMADIFILPSYYETWGLVVNEAMCCECAILVSKLVGSSYDLLKEGENGYSFDPFLLNDLVKKMTAISYDFNNLAALKINSRKIIQNFSYQEVLEQLEVAVSVKGNY